MNRPALISLFLLAVIAVSFMVPKPKYTSLNILSELNIPGEFPGWKSIDVSKELDLRDDRYNFISDVFARLYQNSYGEQLLLLVLDAGNFHNPKICYTSSGFSVKELSDIDYAMKNADFNASALYMKKQNQDVYMFYWLCIDKKVVGWTGQKVKELWASLSNRKKAGLMVRLEIPGSGRTEKGSVALSREFLQTLNDSLTTEQREYLFGR